MVDGRRILGPASLRVRRGERWALLGPNGSGKTTLLSLAGALRQPSRGRVAVLGVELGRADVRDLRARIGHLGHAVSDALPCGLVAEEVVLTGSSPGSRGSRRATGRRPVSSSTSWGAPGWLAGRGSGAARASGNGFSWRGPSSAGRSSSSSTSRPSASTFPGASSSSRRSTGPASAPGRASSPPTTSRTSRPRRRTRPSSARVGWWRPVRSSRSSPSPRSPPASGSRSGCAETSVGGAPGPAPRPARGRISHRRPLLAAHRPSNRGSRRSRKASAASRASRVWARTP